MQATSNVLDKNWKALIKPNKLEITSNDDKTIAKVIAEPLEKGFGQTIGNSLRRILLSSIQGAAVTAIQIDGVLHEFSSIKGVREDVTDIVLNVKNLAIKSSSSSSKKIILDIKGPKEVKAKDITLVPEIEILNPEQTICNLDEKTNLLLVSESLFNARDLTFKTISVTSSRTPFIEVNSCKTPSIWIAVTAVPLIEDKRILLNEFPNVRP